MTKECVRQNVETINTGPCENLSDDRMGVLVYNGADRFYLKRIYALFSVTDDDL